ncbi:MAG: hypothetical protein IPM58_05075 [Nitrospira sp.]|nr:hypothetical protein [Nitrospira sp.]
MKASTFSSLAQREAVGVFGRPLLCGVLKPLGRSPQALAQLAAQFVEGGVDMIKEDQGLVDQRWAPFEERVARCADAIGQASRRRGRPCLYFAHVSGAWDVIRRRATYAKTVGATGLLLAPGLTGFDSLRTLCADDALMLPVACHPAFLGAAVGDCRSGPAPAALYGLLPRLAGADITIYPAFGSDYPMSEPECLSVAASCRRSWGHLRSTMPAVGGRIGAERLTELGTVLGCETIFVLGSRLQKEPDGMAQGDIVKSCVSHEHRLSAPSRHFFTRRRPRFRHRQTLHLRSPLRVSDGRSIAATASGPRARA